MNYYSYVLSYLNSEKFVEKNSEIGIILLELLFRRIALYFLSSKKYTVKIHCSKKKVLGKNTLQ